MCGLLVSDGTVFINPARYIYIYLLFVQGWGWGGGGDVAVYALPLFSDLSSPLNFL